MASWLSRAGLPLLIAGWSVWSGVLLRAAEPAARAAAPAPRVIRGFLERYCVECHGADVAEGDREFASFNPPFTTPQQLITADEIIDQVTLGAMPPVDAARPTDAERVAAPGPAGGAGPVRGHRGTDCHATALPPGIREDVGSFICAAHGHPGPDRRIPARGNVFSYSRWESRRMTVRPPVPSNRSRASCRARRGGEPQTWHFKDHFVQYEELKGSHRSVFKYKYLCLYEQPNTDTRQGGYGHIEDFLDGVPVSGLYDIAVHAQALHRDTHYDPRIFRIDFSEPFQLAVVPGDATKGHIHYPQAIEPRLGEAIVPDDEPAWLTFRVWLEAGQTPRFIFPNGPYESRASIIALNKQYAKELKIEGKKVNGVDRSHLLRQGKLPHIRIDEITIHGPLPEPEGAAEEVAVFGPGGFRADRAVEQLAAFARRAYRHPLDEADRKQIEKLYATRRDEGATERQAALDTLKMILCSPSFLYLTEGTPEDEAWLRPFDLASRLSYALWAQPPDAALDAAAESGELSDPACLERHVLRMLADERSAAFVEDFTDSWLALRDVGLLPPPRQAAGEYYAQDLPASMKREARLFFAALLETNGPITDFLDADYTFVDKKLATLYRLPERETLRLADGFQRVTLPDRRQRGGVLGMAGVLTVSANGVDTSPVTRGVWVMENLLGTPPPPPPDEVPAIESDVSAATTLRERLAKHSADPACAVCHRRIDPLGFALEAFDPIGRHRAKYPKANGAAAALAVDTTGTLPTGDTYADFAEFKQLLVKHRSPAFKRHLIEMLLSYGTGRVMERVDRYEIDDIVARVEADHDGLRTAVVAAFTSRIFRSR